MNRKLLVMVLTIAVSALLVLFPAGDVLSLLALPFTLLGGFLRGLSLRGGAGNMAAIVLYCITCAVPLCCWLRSRRSPADLLLPVLSPVLAWVLYLMVNPGLRPFPLQSEVGDVIYAGAVWSVAISWAVLRLLHSSEELLSGNIYRALRIYLLILAAQLLFVAFYPTMAQFRAELETLKAANTWPGLRLDGTVAFLFLDYMTRAVEKGCLACILYKAADLLKELDADPYSEATVRVAAQVSRWCKNTLVGVTVMDLLLNLGQILFAGQLQNIQMTVRIPASAIAMAFGVLSLTRLLVQGKELKDESDLFI